jgi:hypothetical protein
VKTAIIVVVVLVVAYFVLTRLHVRGTTAGGIPFDIGLGLGGSSGPSDPTAQEIGAGLGGAAQIISAWRKDSTP